MLRAKSRTGARVAAAATSFSVALGATSAKAMVILADKLTSQASISVCSVHYEDCVSRAYITATSLAGDNPKFRQAFDAWNATQAAGAKWTLVDGGALPASNLGIMDFTAIAEFPRGGMILDVNWSYRGDDKESYVWTQGAFVNYVPGPNTSVTIPPYFTLDTYRPGPSDPPCNNLNSTDLVDNHYCAPAYPIQYGNRRLFDRPLGPWPDSSFDAYAMLSRIDAAQRTLTVYEGIGWGFKLSATSVPEPDVWMLMLSGFFGTGLALRRRGRVLGESRQGKLCAGSSARTCSPS